MYIVSIVLIVFAFLFVKSVVGFIHFFEEQSDVQVIDKNSYLNKDSLNVFDLRSKSDTVILFKGVQVLNFWSTWCIPCLEEMPGLHKLQEKYQNLKVALLSFDDTSSLYKTLSEKNITLPAYLVKDTLIFEKPRVLPRTIVLQNDRVIRDMYAARDWSLPEYTAMFDSLTIRNPDQ